MELAQIGRYNDFEFQEGWWFMRGVRWVQLTLLQLILKCGVLYTHNNITGLLKALKAPGQKCID